MIYFLVERHIFLFIFLPIALQHQRLVRQFILTRTGSGEMFMTNPVHVYHKNAAGLISEEVNPDEVLEITSSDDPRITYLRFAQPE